MSCRTLSNAYIIVESTIITLSPLGIMIGHDKEVRIADGKTVVRLNPSNLKMFHYSVKDFVKAIFPITGARLKTPKPVCLLCGGLLALIA